MDAVPRVPTGARASRSGSPVHPQVTAAPPVAAANERMVIEWSRQHVVVSSRNTVTTFRNLQAATLWPRRR